MTQKELKQRYAEILAADVWHGDQRMIDYCVKKAAYIVELENGDIIAIDKPSIEKSFCFGYSDSRYDTEDYDRANNMAHHASTNQDYFMDKNLAGIDKELSALAGKEYFSYYICIPYSGQPSSSGLKALRAYYWHDERAKEQQPLKGADLERVVEGYQTVRADFAKRLQSYLKRYGMSKVKAWSYWQDE